MFFNPFKNRLRKIVETGSFPHARTLRTDFFQKVKDTFFIFAGSLVPFGDKEVAGLFDYATLFIPRTFEFLAMSLLLFTVELVVRGFFRGGSDAYEDRNSTPKEIAFAILAVLPLVLSAIVYGAFLLSRLLISAALTAVSLLITIGVFIPSFFIARPLKEALSNLPISEAEPASQSNNTEYAVKETTLITWLDNKGITIEEWAANSQFDNSDKSIRGKYGNIWLRESRGYPQKEAAFSSLLSLNIGNITSVLEEPNQRLNPGKTDSPAVTPSMIFSK